MTGLNQAAFASQPASLGSGLRDAGDTTARNFRYQHSFGVILLAAAASGKRPYTAVWCEHHEDFIAERSDGRLDYFQVKTRQPEKGAWTMVTPELVHSIKRFTVHEGITGGRVDYHFVSNVDLKAASKSPHSSDTARSPEAFVAHLSQCLTSDEIKPPFRAVFDKLLEACACPGETLLAVLKRLKFLRGPSRESLDATLAHEHLAAIPEFAELTASELGQLRDDLVAAVYRASSLQVTDPTRHLHSLFDQRETHPALIAKRLTIETLREAANRPLPSSVVRDFGDLTDKVAQMLSQMEAIQVGSLNREQAQALLAAFAEENVDTALAFPLLLEKARELDELKRRLAAQERAQPNNKMLQSVHFALDRGDYEGADAALEQIMESEIDGRKSELRETLDIILLRAALAQARLRYGQSAEHFETAAGLARLFDQEIAFQLAGEHAAALLNDAVAKGGAKRFRLALDASERRVIQTEEGSEQHFYAVSQYVNALALYSERSPPAQSRSAIECARRLAESLVQNMDAEKYLDIWVPLASTLGTALSRLSRDAFALGEHEVARELSDQAIETLEGAVERAASSNHPELSNAYNNLATAFRRRSDAMNGSKADLERAINYRERALALLSDRPSIELGNALDSLGNDHKALAVLGPDIDSEAFGNALDAYRRALKCRQFGALPVDWFRTHSNVATMFAAGARLTEGARASRFRAQAVARLRHILRAFGPEDAPSDWISATIYLSRVVGGQLQSGAFVDAELYRETAEHLDKAARIADGGLELGLMLEIHHIQSALPTLLHIYRHPAAIELVMESRRHLHERAQRFGSYGPGPFFSIAVAQADFMLAHLQGDIEAAELAFSDAQSIRDRAKETDDQQFADEIGDALAEMREIILEMEGLASTAS